MPPKLRAVAPGETSPDPVAPPKDLKEAVERSERDLLVAMRTKVAGEIDSGVPAHALAPLMRQLRDIDREIRALDARDEQDAQRSEGAKRERRSFDASAI